MKTTTVSIIAIMIALGFLGGIMFLLKPDVVSNQNGQNVPLLIDGKQVIEIEAKGGYSPKYTTAKANIPTVLKVKTAGTFDCSSALTIPSIGYQKYLPASGETLIELPPQQAGSTLQGICSMGMYNFAINFS